ncbi:antifreeze protein [Roseomonas eburnea]|uniref:Antifreeze protein n=1 Tax=Neoroseomonas eburnea TaxID=1346889 RepID=A0A9X9X7H6_9PROT|nr:hypothetical protein [Neoroseomonas eburnea]MBR0679662.1 antifreeze protein [Neoroseomonas eburnea]
MTVYGTWRFFAEAQTVMLRRSFALWAEPHNAGPALARMVVEKQHAFAQGALAAGFAIARGAEPAAVAAAALRPARQRVRRNLKGEGLA